MKHLRKVLAVAIVLLVFFFLMISGPKATVSGDINMPSGATYLKNGIAELNAKLTANSGDIINTSIDNITFIVYVPFPVLGNITINNSNIFLSGSSGSEYSFDPGTSAYAYLSGYTNELEVTSDYATEYTGDYMFYVEINYTHIDDYGNWETDTYADSRIFSVTEETTRDIGASAGGMVSAPQEDVKFYTIGLGDSISFKTGQEYHSAKLIEMSNEYIVFEFHSGDAGTVKINVGDRQAIDINGDGIDDIEVYFKGFLGGKAYVSITDITPKEEKISAVAQPEPVSVTPPVEPTVVEPNPVEQPVPLGTGIVTVVALAIVGVIVYFVVKRGGK